MARHKELIDAAVAGQARIEDAQAALEAARQDLNAKSRELSDAKATAVDADKALAKDLAKGGVYRHESDGKIAIYYQDASNPRGWTVKHPKDENDDAAGDDGPAPDVDSGEPVPVPSPAPDGGPVIEPAPVPEPGPAPDPFPAPVPAPDGGVVPPVADGGSVTGDPGTAPVDTPTTTTGEPGVTTEPIPNPSPDGDQPTPGDLVAAPTAQAQVASPSPGHNYYGKPTPE